ncbi:MAG: hypothetical protein GY749_41900 [Desulfobacteraceae bacterium]|nr:hypothetical protein [Desulfobacteraceae bacterium]
MRRLKIPQKLRDELLGLDRILHDSSNHNENKDCGYGSSGEPHIDYYDHSDHMDFYSDYSDYSDSNSEDSGWCFITTAICKSLGKGDDCWELNRMRSFRDNYLLKDHNHRELVYEYYAIAPKFLEKLRVLEKHIPLIFTDLYNSFISEILENIAENDNISAISKYKEMLKYIDSL